MSLVAVVGDGCTTTALGLAATWPADEPCMVAEMDPAGGSLAAWLDVPRSPGLADAVASPGATAWPAIEAAIQHTPSGIDVLLAPARALEAAAVIHAASSAVLPVLATIDSPVVIADGGRLRGPLSPLATHAAIIVVAHRQQSGSPAAAAVALERVADLTTMLAMRSIPNVVALIGERPYKAADVAVFVSADVVVPVADDPWSAAMLAGRAGSAVRLRRSSLMRSLADLAQVVSARLRRVRVADDWQQPVDVARWRGGSA